MKCSIKSNKEDDNMAEGIQEGRKICQEKQQRINNKEEKYLTKTYKKIHFSQIICSMKHCATNNKDEENSRQNIKNNKKTSFQKFK